VKRTLLLNGAVAIVAAAFGFGLYKLLLAPKAEPAPAASVTTPVAPVSDYKSVDTLPDFSLQDRSGQQTSIRSWPNKSLIVNFWATWCAPCRKEIPLLMATQRERAKDGFQIVGVAVDVRENVLKYADEIRLDYPLLIGEQDGLDAMASFGIEATAFPMTVFTDQKGRIVGIYPGELDAHKLGTFLDAVSRVNRGALTPAQAQVLISERLEHH
jgi:thiol-disulfide isomerase/thioredoxin